MPDEETANNAKTLLNAGAAFSEFRHLDPSAQEALATVIPDGYRIDIVDPYKLEQWLERPRRKRGLFLFYDVASFGRYFQEHKDDSSRVFIHCNTGEVEGVLNFHGKDAAAWRDHIAALRLQLSADWKKVIEVNGKELSQLALAQFLEEYEHLFASPSGAELLEMVNNLEGKTEVQFRSGLKLSSSQIKLVYDETIDLKGGNSGQKTGSLELPRMLALRVPMFEGGPVSDLTAFLKFKITDRKVMFTVKLHRLEETVAQVFARLSTDISVACGSEPLNVAAGCRFGRD